MLWIDAHGHVPLDIPEATSWQGDFGLAGAMNICVAHEDLGGLNAQREWYRQLSAANPAAWAWATSFSLDHFGGPDWAAGAIAALTHDFTSPGAASACKVWKNVGMELRDALTGDWVFVDDNRFTPIFEYLETHRRPLLMHIAEPVQAWRALDPADPHYSYFSKATKWHWHGRDDVPSHERLIASRDAVVARHPHLPVIGLHLGSHEHDLAAVSARLARYPNYHVDTGARLGDLFVHAERDRNGLIAFFTGWQDRILWGVDFVITRPISTFAAAKRSALHQAMAARYALERRFFSTAEQITWRGRTVQGLELPEPVLQKLVHQNARDLYWPIPALA